MPAALFLGTVVFLYGGGVFVRGARRELAERQPGDDDADQPRHRGWARRDIPVMLSRPVGVIFALSSDSGRFTWQLGS